MNIITDYTKKQLDRSSYISEDKYKRAFDLNRIRLITQKLAGVDNKYTYYYNLTMFQKMIEKLKKLGISVSDEIPQAKNENIIDDEEQIKLAEETWGKELIDSIIDTVISDADSGEYDEPKTDEEIKKEAEDDASSDSDSGEYKMPPFDKEDKETPKNPITEKLEEEGKDKADEIANDSEKGKCDAAGCMVDFVVEYPDGLPSCGTDCDLYQWNSDCGSVCNFAPDCCVSDCCIGDGACTNNCDCCISDRDTHPCEDTPPCNEPPCDTPPCDEPPCDTCTGGDCCVGDIPCADTPPCDTCGAGDYEPPPCDTCSGDSGGCPADCCVADCCIGDGMCASDSTCTNNCDCCVNDSACTNVSCGGDMTCGSDCDCASDCGSNCDGSSCDCGNDCDNYGNCIDSCGGNE